MFTIPEYSISDLRRSLKWLSIYSARIIELTIPSSGVAKTVTVHGGDGFQSIFVASFVATKIGTKIGTKLRPILVSVTINSK